MKTKITLAFPPDCSGLVIEPWAIAEEARNSQWAVVEYDTDHPEVDLGVDIIDGWLALSLSVRRFALRFEDGRAFDYDF